MQNTEADTRARKLLEETSGRITKPRLEVLTTLCSNKRAISHADLQKILPKHDRVSLYRVLHWLIDEKLIESVAGEDGVRRFIAHDPNEEPHPHFHCRSCGLTTCFHAITINQTNTEPDYDIERVSVVVSGLCPKCKTTPSKTS